MSRHARRHYFEAALGRRKVGKEERARIIAQSKRELAGTCGYVYLSSTIDKVTDIPASLIVVSGPTTPLSRLKLSKATILTAPRRAVETKPRLGT